LPVPAGSTAIAASVPTSAPAQAITVPSPPHAKTTSAPASTAARVCPAPGSSTVVSYHRGSGQPARASARVSVRRMRSVSSSFDGLTTTADRGAFTSGSLLYGNELCDPPGDKTG
jgi:hypothetical protein